MSALYELSKDSIYKTKQRIKDKCPDCKKEELFCNNCEKEFILARSIIKANLPLAKVDIIKNQERTEISIVEYNILEKKLTDKPLSLYKNLITPYITKASEVMDHGNSILLSGKNGCGKTLGAITIAIGYIVRSFSVFYCTFPQLHRFHSASFGDPFYAELLEEIQNIDLLIIDELGKETNKTSSVLYLADTYLKAREEYMRPTILITNFHLNELRDDGYGPSFWSMLGERYRIFSFDPKFKDLRLQNRVHWSF